LLTPFLNHPLWSVPLTAVTDDRIAELIARGDEDAFRVLYERYFRIATAVAGRYVRDPLSPEDVAQESFADLWKHRQRYRRERGSIRALLMTITRNRAIDASRGARSACAATVALEAADGATAADDVPAQSERRESRRRTIAAIAALPAPQREVIRLRTFGGLSHSEIARRTGAPLGTVKSRSRLAMVTMHRDLAE
jgi:RNA polymerase sigma-70 factor (ECF subfamily)